MYLVVEQLLNGLQFGLLLFLLAAGLTLVFGIMDFVNLAHGSLYMMGAYFAATFVAWTGNFVLGAMLALGATLLLGMVLEFTALRHLYGRDHLDHVLATFGLILFFNEAVRLIWGPAGLALPLPSWLSVPVQILPGIYYPAYRLAIIVVALLVALLLYLGVIALWRTVDDPSRAARAVAIVTLVGAVDLPIIKFSVEWWNTLHQSASVFRMDGPAIDRSILIPLLVMTGAFTLLFVTLLLAAMRNEILRRRVRTLRLMQASVAG